MCATVVIGYARAVVAGLGSGQGGRCRPSASGAGHGGTASTDRGIDAVRPGHDRPIPESDTNRFTPEIPV